MDIEQSNGLDFDRLKLGFKRRLKGFLITLTICLVVTVAAVVLIPATYQSKSTILIEQQEIPEDLVRSTVTSYADQRIEIISQRVMTSANLWAIVEKYELYEEERKKETREFIINEMREEGIHRNVISAEVVDPRSGRPTEATIAFQLSFEYVNPMLAQRVANELTTLFLSENLKTRTEMAEQAERFLTLEANKLNDSVMELEQQLATFKQEHFQSLPELTDLNLRLMDRTEQAIRENSMAQGVLKERIIYLESQLAQIDPISSVLSSDGQAFLSSKARLKLAKQQLEQAEAKYSQNHPTVIRHRNEIASLLNEVDDVDAPKLKLEIYLRQLSQLKQKYSDEHPEVVSLKSHISALESLSASKSTNQSDSDSEVADNPAYLQIRAQLEATQLELASLDKQTALLREDLKNYEDRITNAPMIEQTYKQLTRDYQSAVLKYAEVKAKQQEANLGRALESEQKGEKFTLIEPPLVPEEPHSPNRKVLVVLGVMLSFGLSIGLVVLREMIDKSIRGRKALINAIGAAPLAIIPHIATPEELVVKRQHIYIAIAVAVVGLVTVMTLFHFFVKPLDVTWYVAMRKFGLM